MFKHAKKDIKLIIIIDMFLPWGIHHCYRAEVTTRQSKDCSQNPKYIIIMD